MHTLHIPPHGCTIPAGHCRTEHAQLESELVKTDVKDCETNSKGEDRQVSFPQCPGPTVGQRHHLHQLHTRMGQGVYLLTALDLWGFLFTLRAEFSPCQVNLPLPADGGTGLIPAEEMQRMQGWRWQGHNHKGRRKMAAANSEVKLSKIWPDYCWQMILYSDCLNKYNVSWGVCSQKHNFITWHILHALTNNLLIMCKLEVIVDKSGWQKMEYWILYCYLCKVIRERVIQRFIFYTNHE